MSTSHPPFTSFNFLVEIDHIESGGFSQISGLTSEIDLEDYREGGTNDFIYKLPKLTKYPNITLKRGIADSTDLYDWYLDISRGKITTKDLAIVLLNSKKKEARRWQFKKAFPIKWVGPDLDAIQGKVAFESIEIVHKGIVV